jgi:hypothetical protein
MIGYAVGQHITTTLYYGSRKDEAQTTYDTLNRAYKNKTAFPLGVTGFSILVEEVLPIIDLDDGTYVVQAKGEVSSAMKHLEININEFLALGGTPTSRGNWIKSKLKEAGFDTDKEIIALIDTQNMKYTYIQDNK